MIQFKPLTAKSEWAWFHQRTFTIACEDSQGIVAYDDSTQTIAAVCVADSFTVDACNVHFAIERPIVIKHGFLHEIARHLFIACGRKRIFGLVPANNSKALKLDTHIGFREVARVPDGYAEGIDYVVLRMDRETSPWLEQIRRAA
jgi:hypothetical protein